jgi:hypothetical protein
MGLAVRAVAGSRRWRFRGREANRIRNSLIEGLAGEKRLHFLALSMRTKSAQLESEVKTEDRQRTANQSGRDVLQIDHIRKIRSFFEAAQGICSARTVGPGLPR